MRNTVLVDAGAIVAILSRGDHFHAQITELLKNYEGRLLTTWPVIAEACSMMPGDRQRRVLDWMGLRGIEVVSIDDGLEFMRARMAEYADLPCDFADASLLYAAWRTDSGQAGKLPQPELALRIEIELGQHSSARLAEQSGGSAFHGALDSSAYALNLAACARTEAWGKWGQSTIFRISE